MFVVGELMCYGYCFVVFGEKVDMVVCMDYGIDKGCECVVFLFGFGNFWYGGYYGCGFYLLFVIVCGFCGCCYIYGWCDFFMWGGFGLSWGYNDVESFIVYISDFNL